MSKRPRIAIVLGRQPNLGILEQYRSLSGEFELEGFAIETPGMLEGVDPSMQLNLFQDLKDMPGYMRSLEDILGSFDAIVSVESSVLSTFQAVRAGAKYGRGVAVVVNEYKPYFYNNFPNIRAIQQDVFSNADLFWPTTNLAEKMLMIEGIDTEKCQLIRPHIDGKRFAYSDSLRDKFRQYVGFGPDDFIFMIRTEFDGAINHSRILQALKLMTTIDEHCARHVKMVFVGSGEGANDVKYMASDMGLANRVAFLQQDHRGFARDLYSAIDAVLVPRFERQDLQETFPTHVGEACSAGLPILTDSGTIAQELAGSNSVALTDDSFQTLGVAMRDLVKDRLDKPRQHEVDLDSSSDELATQLRRLLDISAEKNQKGFDLEKAVDSIGSTMSDSGHLAALEEIEEALLHDIPLARDRAEINRIKGDILMSAGSFEESMESFSSSIRLDHDNFMSYCGLGYLAYRGHSNQEAMTFFRRCLSLNPDYVPALRGTGMVRLRLGMIDAAMYFFERCLVLDPEDKQSLTGLLQASMETLSVKEAINTLEGLKDSSKGDRALTLTLGQLYLKDGRTEIGNRMVQEALDSDPDAPAAS